MVNLLRVWGRVLLWNAPALMAVYLIGHTAHYGLIYVAGVVGSTSALGMIFVAPLAILAKLTAFVSMLLITRDSLPHLSAIAPRAEQTRTARRTGFVEALLTSVIPFFAFYVAAGFFTEDMRSIMNVAVSLVGAGIEGNELNAVSFPVTWAMIVVFVVAFVLKQLWERFSERVPRWTRGIAVYLEVVWVLIFIYVGKSVIDVFRLWSDDRAVFAWFRSIGEWFAVNLPVVAAVWEGLGVFIATLLGLTATALAWLTIAGVVFGETIKAARPDFARIEFTGLQRLSKRYTSLDADTRRRIAESFGLATGRLKPLWDAIVLMFRSGPALIGLYILLSQAWLLFDRTLKTVIPRMFGPHDIWTWWDLYLPLVFVLPVLISEPVRIALIAAAYDATLARIGRKPTAPLSSAPAVDIASAPGEGIPTRASVATDLTDPVSQQPRHPEPS